MLTSLARVVTTSHEERIGTTKHKSDSFISLGSAAGNTTTQNKKDQP